MRAKTRPSLESSVNYYSLLQKHRIICRRRSQRVRQSKEPPARASDRACHARPAAATSALTARGVGLAPRPCAFCPAAHPEDQKLNHAVRRSDPLVLGMEVYQAEESKANALPAEMATLTWPGMLSNSCGSASISLPRWCVVVVEGTRVK